MTPTRKPPRLALAVLALVAIPIGYWVFTRPDWIHGNDATGWGVKLTNRGGKLASAAEADAVADSANRWIQSEASQWLSSVLPEVLTAAGLARDEASWRFDPTGFDSKSVLESRMGYFNSLRGTPPSREIPVDHLDMTIQMQCAPWPREPKFTPHPESLMCQVGVEWWTSNPEHFPMGRVAADAIARRLTERLREIAAEAGYSSSFISPDGEVLAELDPISDQQLARQGLRQAGAPQKSE